MKFNMVVLIIIDAVLAAAALFSAAAARFGYTELRQMMLDSATWYTMIIFVVVLLFSAHLMESYDQGKNVKKREIAINIVFGAVTSFFLLSVVYYLDPDVTLGRGVLFLSLCLFALFQFSWHSLYLLGKNHRRFSRRVLVLGTGALAAQIGAMITANQRNFMLAGYVSCTVGPNSNDTESALPDVSQDMVLGNCDDLRDIALQAQAEVIVVALAERRGVFPLRDVLRCKLNNILVMDTPAFYELAQGKLMLESITPSWCFSGRSGLATMKNCLCSVSFAPWGRMPKRKPVQSGRKRMIPG